MFVKWTDGPNSQTYSCRIVETLNGTSTLILRDALRLPGVAGFRTADVYVSSGLVEVASVDNESEALSLPPVGRTRPVDRNES